MRTALVALIGLGVLIALSGGTALAAEADIIFHGGPIITADAKGTVAGALAVEGERILRVGSKEEVLKARGPRTRMVDLEGKAVLPGLIDSHVHPDGASLTEFDHPVPEMASVEDVLRYVRERAEALGPGEWITVRQVFITRLAERRWPTREELDRAAPRNPVLFSTGPDASLSSLALELSGIDRDFVVEGPGKVERDASGRPSGILRNCTRYVKVREPRGRKEPREEDRLERLRQLLRDYARQGITSIGDRDSSPEGIERYRKLLERGELPVRVACSHSLSASGTVEEVRERIRRIAGHPLRRGGPLLRVIGVKTYLDGGMLTGSAYLREPWGVSRIYSIDDPNYRGVLFIPPEKLRPMTLEALRRGLQFTAHAVGDGAVHALLDAYRAAATEVDIRPARPCLTHSNFMSREAVEEMVRLGVAADIQPIWLHLDGRTLREQFGDERLRWFQPLRTIFEAGAIAGGGSDHMQKIGAMRAINPYHPFLGMWIAVTRRARGLEGPLHPQEALSRAQAIRFYTWNNAWILHQERETGSLEEGKLADLIIVDRDPLTCPEDDLPRIQVLQTYLGGN